MQELRWMEPLPSHTLEGGIGLLQELKWNLKITQSDAGWFVNAGHIKLLKTSSREALDAFLYGMALAYSVMPSAILDQFRARMKAATE